MKRRKVVVLDVVGLTPRLLGPDTPHLSEFARSGGQRNLRTVTPAVTCTAQSTYLTGLMPSEHGVVGNGWYFRDLSEIHFWRQSNRLVAGEKIWETARRHDGDVTCAKLFWWYNMYSSADWSVTPRPMYPADGRKLPDVYTQPAGLRDELNHLLGQFPLFNFWGPTADIRSSRWIARCTQHVYDTRQPTLTLVYLPHLDYPLQKLGPNHPDVPRYLREVDTLCGELIEHFRKDGAEVIVLSEYGITPVTGAVAINRVLRQAGHLRVREELGRELLDAGISDAFAVCDHQLAHVYVRRPDLVRSVKALLEQVDGIEAVWDEEGKRAHGLDHPRSGELVALSRADRWFSYYYWMDDARAPDFARTVDIHRKPGYDPVELFLDPALSLPQVHIAWRLLKKSAGMRTLMDLIPLDDSLVRGSHGRLTDDPLDGPVLLSSLPDLLPEGPVAGTEVKQLVLDHLFATEPTRRTGRDAV